MDVLKGEDIEGSVCGDTCKYCARGGCKTAGIQTGTGCFTSDNSKRSVPKARPNYEWLHGNYSLTRNEIGNIFIRFLCRLLYSMLSHCHLLCLCSLLCSNYSFHVFIIHFIFVLMFRVL